MENEQDVIVDSSTTDAGADSSTVELVETPTPKVVQEAEKTVPYDRFREVNEEKKQLQALVQQLATRQEKGETLKEIEADPYDGMSADELKFYRSLDQRTQNLIQKEAGRIAAPLQNQVQKLATQMTRIMEQEFRTKNTDVEPNSQEEQKIAGLINNGLSLDEATWAIMGPKRVKAAESVKHQVVQTKTQQKQQANLETSGIPNGSPLPRTEKLGFREFLDAQMKKEGL